MQKIAIVLLASLLILSACKKQVACDPQDSRKVCEAFQQCLRSDTSTEVCKMGEQDANKIEKGSTH
jgi:hypothetical protein